MDGQNFQNGQNAENAQTEQQSAPVDNYQDNTGASQQYQQASPAVSQEPQKSSALAIISLVMGILAILLGCCTAYIGIIPGIAGIVCAVLANKQGKSGMATAGMICSIIGIIIGIVMTIITAVFGVAIMSAINDSGYYY